MIHVSDPLPIDEHDPYSKSKVKAENYIRKSNINWSIFRLTAIMGIGNHKLSPLMFEMPLATKMEIATVKDTARAFVNAIDSRKQIERPDIQFIRRRILQNNLQRFSSKGIFSLSDSEN